MLETGAVLVHPKMAIYDSSAWHLASHLPLLLRGNHEPSGCVAVSAADFQALGGYNPACNPIVNSGGCHEDVELGLRAAHYFGHAAVRVLPVYVGASARRWKKFGFFVHGKQFATPVRSVTRKP